DVPDGTGPRDSAADAAVCPSLPDGGIDCFDPGCFGNSACTGPCSMRQVNGCMSCLVSAITAFPACQTLAVALSLFALAAGCCNTAGQCDPMCVTANCATQVSAGVACAMGCPAAQSCFF